MPLAYNKKALLLRRPYLTATLRDIHNEEHSETVANSQKAANEAWLDKLEHILIVLDPSVFRDFSNQAISRDETLVDSSRIGDNDNVIEWRICLGGGKIVGRNRYSRDAPTPPKSAKKAPAPQQSPQQLLEEMVQKAVQKLLLAESAKSFAHSIARTGNEEESEEEAQQEERNNH